MSSAPIARQIAKEIEEKELPRRGQTILTVETMFSRWIIEHGKELRSSKDITNPAIIYVTRFVQAA
jgi:hypothetical protein